MGLAEDLAAAKAAAAAAAFAVQEHRAGLDQHRSAGGFSVAGARLTDLETRKTEAAEHLERTEREVLEKARAIVSERDPAYLTEIAAAKLVPAVEEFALIGAADRLTA